MLRTKVVQGILTADQAEVMASITEDFARGIIDCTTRQCFQNHWLRLDEVPEVFSRLEQVGMTTLGRLRRHHPQRHRLHARRDRPRPDPRRPRHGRGDPRLLPRQQALLEPAAQVQGLGHRLPRGLRPRPHQRPRPVGRDPRGRHARLQHPRRRRAVERAALLPRDRRLRDARGGARGRRRDHRDLPRLRREPRQARPRAAEVPRRRDGRRRLPRRAGAPARPRADPGRAHRPGHEGPRPHRRHPAERRRALRGRLLRAGRAPARRPAARVRPARPRVRDRPRDPPHAPAERAAAVDPERPRRGAAGRAARPGALADAAAVHARPPDLHRQGVLRAGQGPHEGAGGRDRALPRHPRRQERPRRGLPPALRGLLVELRPAPDRRRRDRGRAQEGRRRVRRGDGHPHRRPARARPALRRRRAQEGAALGPRRDAAADLLARTRPATARARRSATSRAAPSPSGGPSS